MRRGNWMQGYGSGSIASEARLCPGCKGDLYRPPIDQTRQTHTTCQRCAAKACLQANPDMVEVTQELFLLSEVLRPVTKNVTYYGTLYSMLLAPRWVQVISDAWPKSQAKGSGSDFSKLKAVMWACARNPEMVELLLSARQLGGDSALYSLAQTRILGAP